MQITTMRLISWGVLIAFIGLGIAAIALKHASETIEEQVAREVRQILLDVDGTLRTGKGGTLTITSLDDTEEPVNAWGTARLDGWLVRNDLAYLEHVEVASSVTSTVVMDFNPTQPGTYRLVVTGSRKDNVTIGASNIQVSGGARDVPPDEQSAGRSGMKLVLSTIPEVDAIRAGQPISFTFLVSRTDTPVPLDERNGVRGSLVAFRENGSRFVLGEPLTKNLLPSNAAAAFTMVFPEAGSYRVFFEFYNNGKKYTEARWIEVKAAD